jgi:hypothetical protein
MADDTTQQRDPSSGSTGRAPRDEIDEAGSNSNRRRIIITSLLTPPAVMTLNARRANAASTHPSMNPGYGTTTGTAKGKGKG